MYWRKNHSLVPKSLSGVFYCKCFFLEVMYDVFCTHAQPCFLRIWLAHREELEVSNIRLNFFCWYLRKFPERHSNLRKRKQRIGGIGSVMSLRHHSLTVRFDMAVRHVMKRMYVYGNNSDQPTLCQSSLQSQSWLSRAHDLQASHQSSAG